MNVYKANSTFQGTLLGVSRSITLDNLGTGTAAGVDAGADGIWGTKDDNFGFNGRVIGALSCPPTCTTPGIAQTADGLQLIIHSGAEVNGPTGKFPPTGIPAVPEPNSFLLFGSGLVLAASLSMWKQRKGTAVK